MASEDSSETVDNRIRRLAQLLDETSRFAFRDAVEAHHFAVAIEDVRRALDLRSLGSGLAGTAAAADDVLDPLTSAIDSAERMAKASTRQFLRMVQWRRPKLAPGADGTTQ